MSLNANHGTGIRPWLSFKRKKWRLPLPAGELLRECDNNDRIKN